MGVSRDLQVDGIPGHVVGEIGFVHGDDFGFGGGHSPKSLVDVIGPCIDVVDADDPDALAVSLQRDRLVPQDLQAMAMQGVGDDVGIVPVVVVTEDSEQRRPVQLLQDFGTRFGVAGTGGSVRLEQRVRNEITGEDGEIGFQRERETHAALDLGLAYIRAKVQISQDSDAKPVERFRQISQAYGDVFGNQRVRLKQ